MLKPYFEQTCQIVDKQQDLLELCLLITYCFEDNAQVQGAREGVELSKISSKLIEGSLTNISTKGMLV